jgi:hypothetical protein
MDIKLYTAKVNQIKQKYDDELDFAKKKHACQISRVNNLLQYIIELNHLRSLVSSNQYIHIDSLLTSVYRLIDEIN